MLNRTQPPAIKDAVDFKYELQPYQKHVLSNGVVVYAVDAGAEEVLQIEWVFYAGNSFEKNNLVAASTNYLLKNGTHQKSAFEINEHFEYYGAYLNRSCFNETAVLNLHCLSKHVAALLPMVRELLTSASFPEQEIAVYRQNMKQRLNVNLKKSDFIATRLIDTYLYGPHHPYGRFSSFEDFDALTREQLLAFYNQYYVNGKWVLFVSGRLPGNIMSLLEEQFGDLKNNPGISVPAHPAAPAAEKKYRIVNDVQGVQGAVRLGTNFPNRHHPDFVKAQVLNCVLGGFFGSRLMSNIREEKGYTYGIYSYLENHIQQSAWVISTDAGRDVCEATIYEVYKEMERLRNEAVDDNFLLLVRNYMLGLILGDLDGPFHIMNRWKNILLNGLPEDFFNHQINTIKTVTANELQQLANRYLVPQNFYELVVV